MRLRPPTVLTSGAQLTLPQWTAGTEGGRPRNTLPEAVAAKSRLRSSESHA